MMVKRLASNAFCVLENIRLVIKPVVAVNCAAWLNDWSPLVTGNKRLVAVNTCGPPTVLFTVSVLCKSGDPQGKLI